MAWSSNMTTEGSVKQLMKLYVARLDINDSMDVIVKVFGRTQAWTLPVVDRDGHFLGFIRKSRVFTVYRKMMSDYSDD